MELDRGGSELSQTQENENERALLKNQSWPDSRTEIGEGERVWKRRGLDLVSTHLGEKILCNKRVTRDVSPAILLRYNAIEKFQAGLKTHREVK